MFLHTKLFTSPLVSGLPGGISDIDAIAVTQGPGLAPCLKVGMQQAIGLSREWRKPLIHVNHLEAHALVPRLMDPKLSFPFLVLLVSGGHCMLLLCEGVGQYQTLGQTLDDSLGETFDKVSRTVKKKYQSDVH